MKRFLVIFLSLTCMMAAFCAASAAVECQMPQKLPATAGLAVHDVLIIGGAAEDAGVDAPVEDTPADAAADPWAPGADGKYATMGALYQAWGGYAGYPDYVCGVWSTDGGMDRMTVAVTDDRAGAQGREEILSQLSDPTTVTFVTQTYSYEELQAVMDEITAQMGPDSPVYACGVYEMENKVGVELLEGHADAQQTAEALLAAYGDKVRVTMGEGLYFETGLKQDSGLAKAGIKPVLFAAAILAVFAAAAIALRLPARVTAEGKVVTQGKPTRAQVEAALAEQTETPPDRVETQINKKL